MILSFPPKLARTGPTGLVSSPAAHALNEREGGHTKSTFLDKIRLSNQITVFCDLMCDVDFKFNMANNCLI